jgi:hypothetical protein
MKRSGHQCLSNIMVAATMRRLDDDDISGKWYNEKPGLESIFLSAN